MKVYYDPSFLIALYLIEPLSPGAQKMWNNCQFRGSRARRGVAGYCREVPEVPAPKHSCRSSRQSQCRQSDMIATLSNKRQSRLPGILEHASGDKRFKILEAHMKKHQFKQDALIEVLHKAQELFGYLEDDLLLFVAYKLKLPASRVYGVATFYHFFTLKPQGRHTCVVCMGTACYVKGRRQGACGGRGEGEDQGRRNHPGQPAFAADRPVHRRLRHRPGRGL